MPLKEDQRSHMGLYRASEYVFRDKNFWDCLFKRYPARDKDLEGLRFFMFEITTTVIGTHGIMSTVIYIVSKNGVCHYHSWNDPFIDKLRAQKGTWMEIRQKADRVLSRDDCIKIYEMIDDIRSLKGDIENMLSRRLQRYVSL